MDFPTISLDIGRTVVELSSEAAVRLRIASSSMRRETLVTVYDANGAGRVRRAGDIPQLAPLFLDLLGPEPVETPEPPDEVEESVAATLPAAATETLEKPAPAAAPARQEVPGIVAYARRRVSLFAEPSSSATPIASLRRGDIAQVAVATPAALAVAQGFVGVTSGGASMFGYAAAFSTAAPPALIAPLDDEPATLGRRVVALAEPGDTAGRTLERGAPVLVAGRLADGRYEVLADDGRIAYLPPNALDPEPALAAAALKAAPPPPAVAPASAEAPAVRPQTASKGSPAVPVLVIGGVVGLLIIAVVLTFHSSNNSGPSAPVRVNVYVLRGVDVRSGPATGDNVVADQQNGPQRGASITGTWTTSANGQTWLAVTDGPYKGDYIWGRNLSSNAPSNLTSQVTGQRTPSSAVSVYPTPDTGQAAVQSLEQGQAVDVVGEDGQLAEILLKRGGVGYISASAVGA